MSSQTSYIGATVFDIMGADSSQTVKNVFTADVGTNPQSNINLIDAKMLTHHNRLSSLESLVEGYSKIETFQCLWDSVVSNVDYYTAVNPNVKTLENDSLFIVYFDKTNTGSVTFKLNDFPVYAIKKTDHLGELTTMDGADIKINIPYLIQFKNSQMILVGENFAQDIGGIQESVMSLNTDVLTHIENETIHLASGEKAKVEVLTTEGDGTAYLANDGLYKVLPVATTLQAGLVQLSSVIDSADEDKAATPLAVKTAYEYAAIKAMPLIAPTGTDVTLPVNTKSNLGAVSGAVNITLGTPLEGYSNDWEIIFTVGETIPTITFPSTIKWLDEAPAYEANKAYRIIISEDVGAYHGVFGGWDV